MQEPANLILQVHKRHNAGSAREHYVGLLQALVRHSKRTIQRVRHGDLAAIP